VGAALPLHPVTASERGSAHETMSDVERAKREKSFIERDLRYRHPALGAAPPHAAEG
jgi:hypothetical protein